MRKYYHHVNLNGGDFPGGSVVESLPANAGDMGSIPGPHAIEQLSLCAPTTEPALSLMRSLSTATREKPLLATTRESMCAAMKTQHK